MITGTWQLQLGLLVGSIFVLYNYPSDVDFLIHSLIVFHFCMTICCAIRHSMRKHYENLNLILSFLGMMFSLWIITQVSDQINNWVINPFKSGLPARQMWYTLELFFLFSIVLSHITFLLIRTFTKVKVSNEKLLDPSLCFQDKDILSSKSFHMNCWNVEMTLAFISCIIHHSGLLDFEHPCRKMHKAMKIIGYSA